MSETEYQPLEQRSKIKLVRNAKGDPQWEISVVVGDTATDLDAARAVAVDQWRKLTSELGVWTGKAA